MIALPTIRSACRLQRLWPYCVRESIPSSIAEDVPLSSAYGRILAEPLISRRDVPSFDNVAVDGFAFAYAALGSDGPSRLPLIEGRSAAGHPFEGTVPLGHAVRVLTGGALPNGTDTALMQEDVTLDGDHVLIPTGVKPGANCRLAGEDMKNGQVVLEPGLRLRPQEVGVAATIGRPSIKVYQPLRVALVSSGDELREPGEPLPHGMTYDSNRTILRGLLETLGITISDQGIWPDRADVVQERMQALVDDHHVIITSGGASRGDEDHMVEAIRQLGQLHFWQIAVKPGRPLAFGQLQGRFKRYRLYWPSRQPGCGGDLFSFVCKADANSPRRRQLAGTKCLSRARRFLHDKKTGAPRILAGATASPT